VPVYTPGVLWTKISGLEGSFTDSVLSVGGKGVLQAVSAQPQEGYERERRERKKPLRFL
jgi:hypothetical protein